MFASRVQKTIEVEGEPVLIQKLSAKSLDKAARAAQMQSLADVREAGAEVLRAFRDSDAVDRARKAMEERKLDPEAQRKARYGAYDRELVLLAGVVSLPGAEKVTREVLDDLDIEAAQQIHEAILDLSLPPLTEAEATAEEGKD